jgi:hypothetical protein
VTTPKLTDQLLDLGGDAPGMVMYLVAAVLQPRDAFPLVTHQPGITFGLEPFIDSTRS